MATNPTPSSILNRKVVFAAVNEGNVINEPFKVYGPYGQGVSMTKLKIGNKGVIPLTNETGEGKFFLKLHFPSTRSTNPNINRTLYVTFCKKDHTYDDGYKDFVNRVPEAYITALKFWIDDGKTPSTSGQARYRKLSFVGYGTETAQIQNATNFEMRFSYRGTQITNNDPMVNNNANVVGPNNTNMIELNNTNVVGPNNFNTNNVAPTVR